MNQPLVIEETWVREALLTVLPPGIVGHRLPEVMAEIGKAPQTWTGIEEAFFRPLHLFIRHHDPRREQLRLQLVEQIERVLIQDDRPYVSEWIEAQKLDWMRQDKPWWAARLKEADRESRLPNCKAKVQSERTRNAQWWKTFDRYAEKWRVPPVLTNAHIDGTIKTPSDWVRQVRFIERGLVRKSFLPVLDDYNIPARYGADVANQLSRHISEMTKDLDCVDNIRVALAGDRMEMNHYRWRKSQGCCGSVDREVFVNGQRFAIGCNYGH